MGFRTRRSDDRADAPTNGRGIGLRRRGGEQAGDGEGERRLAGAVRAGDRKRPTGADVEVDTGRGGNGSVTRDGEVACDEQHGLLCRFRTGRCGSLRLRGFAAPLSNRGRAGDRGRAGGACGSLRLRGFAAPLSNRVRGGIRGRQPDARRLEPLGVRGEHLIRAPIGQHATRPDHHHAVHMRRPRVDAVLDDDERRAARFDGPQHGVAHLAHAVGIELRRRLVEQQQARPHRQCAGKREPLLLPARQRRGGVVQRQLEPDRP